MNKLKAILKQAIPVLVALTAWELIVKDVVMQTINGIENK